MSEQLRRAKRPRTALAGPYGHPFHAILVTVPIGAWIASVVFDVLTLSSTEPAAFALGARWLIGIGLVGALLAAVVGLMDLSVIAKRTRARRIALLHMTLNLTVIALFAVSLTIRLLAADAGSASIGGIVASVVALVLLGISGILGGELSYRFGVRVADEETQRSGFES